MMCENDQRMNSVSQSYKLLNGLILMHDYVVY